MKRVDSKISTEEKYYLNNKTGKAVSAYYGEDTFSPKIMEKMLPKDVYNSYTERIANRKKIDLDIANSIAHAMKEWAIDKGATHFSHWFQPMTSLTAE